MESEPLIIGAPHLHWMTRFEHLFARILRLRAQFWTIYS